MAVVEVVLSPEVVAVLQIDIFLDKAQILERIDVAAFTDRDPIADDDILRIEDARRGQDLGVNAEIGKLRLVFAVERLRPPRASSCRALLA